MSRTTRPSILQQRVRSLLTGEVRENPIVPLRHVAGMVEIGSQRTKVRVWTVEDLEMADAIEKAAYNIEKQLVKGHDCLAMQMGEYCPHATN